MTVTQPRHERLYHLLPARGRSKERYALRQAKIRERTFGKYSEAMMYLANPVEVEVLSVPTMGVPETIVGNDNFEYSSEPQSS